MLFLPKSSDDQLVGEVELQRLDEDAILPTRAHPEDAGLDLYNLVDVFLQPGEGKLVRTGIAVALPLGTVELIADRSSLGKKGIKSLGGVIDAGYRGEIHIILWNLSQQLIQLKKGERIAQLLILPIQTPKVREVKQLSSETGRGTKGFGSTGA